MIGWLESIASTLEQVGRLFLWASVEVLNVCTSAYNAIFLAAVAALPNLPETVPPPGVVTGLNWAVNVGALFSIATTMAVSYVSFLAVRWVFRKAGSM